MRNILFQERYTTTLDDITLASQDTFTKSRRIYYILGKYEIMQCGDVEKLVKKRSSTDQSKYYVCIEENCYSNLAGKILHIDGAIRLVLALEYPP